MKTFALAVLCFALMLTGLFIFLNYAENTCNELLGELDGVLQAVDADNMEEAKSKVEEFARKWNKKRKILSIFTDNAVNDVITENVTAMEYFAELEEKGEIVSRAGVIKEFIENIYRLEKPTLENIL